MSESVLCVFDERLLYVRNMAIVRLKYGFYAFKIWLLCVPNVAFMRSKIDFCVFCRYVFPVVKEFFFAVYSLGFLCEMEGVDS